jgi:hypothetical protein
MACHNRARGPLLAARQTGAIIKGAAKHKLTIGRLPPTKPYQESLFEAIYEQWPDGTPKPEVVQLPPPRDADEREQLERFLVYYPRAAAAGELFPFQFTVADR